VASADDKEAIDAIARLVEDKDRSVMNAALKANGQMQALLEQTDEPLDDDPGCRSATFDALGSGEEAEAPQSCHLTGVVRKSVDWQACATTAKQISQIYQKGFEFPSWSIDMLANGELADVAGHAEIYYSNRENFKDVEKVALQREPVNIAMERYYDKHQLSQKFGHELGGYSESTRLKLMPNIAIYCKTPMSSSGGEKAVVHVINAVAYAFDSAKQPDYQYFFPLNETKWKELVRRMSEMWTFIFVCAKRKGLKRIYLSDVGGGAFAGLLAHPYDYPRLKRESLDGVQAKYSGIDVQVLPRIPDFVFGEGRELVKNSLLVNAWDPWSMVGNGNSKDNSLDGFFGRCSALAVLAWPRTNPCIQYVKVEEDVVI
jgi:hypothetical protein